MFYHIYIYIYIYIYTNSDCRQSFILASEMIVSRQRLDSSILLYKVQSTVLRLITMETMCIRRTKKMRKQEEEEEENDGRNGKWRE